METEVDDIFRNLEKNKTSQKKRKNVKVKGDRGELKVCKILTENFGEEFSRVPRSGGFGTTHNLDETATAVLAGDIITPSSFIFVLECKTGYDIDLINTFCCQYTSCRKKSSDKNLILDFINQSCRDAVRANLIPAVIYKKDYRPPLFILPLDNFCNEQILRENLDKFEQYMIFRYTPKYAPEWTRWILVSLEEALKILPNSFFYI